MVAAISSPTFRAAPGTRPCSGALDHGFEDAYGMQFRMARVYARALTIAEMQANWAAIFGEATATPGVARNVGPRTPRGHASGEGGIGE